MDSFQDPPLVGPKVSEGTPLLSKEDHAEYGDDREADSSAVDYGEEDDATRSKRFRFTVLGLVMLPTLANNYVFEVLSIVVVPLKKHYDISNDQFGLLYSFYEVPNIILPLLGGALLSRLGATKGSVLLCIVCAVGAVMCAISVPTKSFPLLLAGRTVYGIGAESLTMGVEILVSVYFQEFELSFAYGVLIAVSRFGDTLPCFSPYIQDLFFGSDPANPLTAESPIGFAVPLWACVFLLAGGVVSLVVLFVAEGNELFALGTAAEDEDVAAADTDTQEASFASVLGLLGKQFWIFTVISAAAGASYSPFIIYTPDMLHAERGLSQKEASHYVVLLYGVAMVLAPFLGGFMDRYGYRPQLVVWSLIVKVFAYRAVEDPRLPLPLSIGLVATSSAVAYSALFSILPLTSPGPQYFSHCYAIYTAVGNLCLSFTYWFVGKLTTEGSYAQAFTFYIAVTAVSAALAAWLWWLDVSTDGRLSANAETLSQESLLHSMQEHVECDKTFSDIHNRRNIPLGLSNPYETLSNQMATDRFAVDSWGTGRGLNWWQSGDYGLPYSQPVPVRRLTVPVPSLSLQPPQAHAQDSLLLPLDAEDDRNLKRAMSFPDIRGSELFKLAEGDDEADAGGRLPSADLWLHRPASSVPDSVTDTETEADARSSKDPEPADPGIGGSGPTESS